MLKVTPVPAGEAVSEDFKMVLNGKETVQLYRARVSAMPYNTVWPGCQRPLDQTEPASFCSFESDGPVTVRLTAAKDFREVVVRPLSRKVTVCSQGRDIYFTLPRAGQYTVELDGFASALHVFFNPPADFGVRPDDPDVIYFGPGVHRPGVIDAKAGQTVYIDSGAVVYGSVESICADNVRVVGYGIIDGSWEGRETPDFLYATDYDRPIPLEEEAIRAFLKKNRVLKGGVRFYNCRNVGISGVVVRDTATFAVIPTYCENVTFENVKTIGMWRYNSDGIDLLNTRNCVIRGCFLRDFDDCIVLKGVKGWDERNVENVLVQGCTVWCDWGRALEVGAETCAEEYRNIIFEDCDLIHGNDIMLDIQNGERAEVHDVTFRNIRCEYNRRQKPTIYQHDMTKPYPGTGHDWQPYFIKMHSYYVDKLFSHDGRFGNIHDITVKDVSVTADEGVGVPKSFFEGIDEQHLTQDIRISGITFNGRPLKTPEEANFTCNEFTRGISLS